MKPSAGPAVAAAAGAMANWRNGRCAGSRNELEKLEEGSAKGEWRFYTSGDQK